MAEARVCTDSFPTRINKTNKPQTSQVISESESIVGGGVQREIERHS